MTEGAAKCPHCMSENVEPRDPIGWHCNNCGKDFKEAAVDIPQPNPKKKGK